jgi:hypothetical protein
MLIFIAILAVVIVIYLHMLFHWKVSNEIDIPHVLAPKKGKLERIGDTHQPFIFERKIEEENIVTKGMEQDVTIKTEKSLIKVPHKAMLSAVRENAYICENNQAFLKTTNLVRANKGLSELDDYLRPPMTMNTNYNIIYGNSNVATKLKHSLNYRNYLCVMEGDVEIKLSPPKSLAIFKNNKENDLWDTKDKYSSCDIILLPIKKGSIIHIPAYWSYTIRFPKFACVMSFSYITYTNALAQIPERMRIKKIDFF